MNSTTKICFSQVIYAMYTNAYCEVTNYDVYRNSRTRINIKAKLERRKERKTMHDKKGADT